MIYVDVPSDMRGLPAENELAEGPFVVFHNGERWVGSNLRRFGPDLIGLWDGGRGYDMDTSYHIQTVGDMITMVSPQYDSTFILRPVRLEDAEWAMPDDYQATTVEQLRDDLLNILGNGSA